METLAVIRTQVIVRECTLYTSHHAACQWLPPELLRHIRNDSRVSWAGCVQGLHDSITDIEMGAAPLIRSTAVVAHELRDLQVEERKKAAVVIQRAFK